MFYFYRNVLAIDPPLFFSIEWDFVSMWNCKKQHPEYFPKFTVIWIQSPLKSVMEVLSTVFLQWSGEILCSDWNESPWTRSHSSSKHVLSITLQCYGIKYVFRAIYKRTQPKIDAAGVVSVLQALLACVFSPRAIPLPLILGKCFLGLCWGALTLLPTHRPHWLAAGLCHNAKGCFQLRFGWGHFVLVCR